MNKKEYLEMKNMVEKLKNSIEEFKRKLRVSLRNTGKSRAVHNRA